MTDATSARHPTIYLLSDHLDAALDEVLHERHGGIDAGAEDREIVAPVQAFVIGRQPRDDADALRAREVRVEGSGAPLVVVRLAILDRRNQRMLALRDNMLELLAGIFAGTPPARESLLGRIERAITSAHMSRSPRV